MSTGPEIEARDISWTAGGALIVDGVSCTVPAGMVTGLVGPNGAGKTTLLRRIARLRAGSGAVLIGGEDTARWSRDRAARTTAIVMQEATTETDPLVWEVVMLGRTPHHGLLDRDSADDERRVRDALVQVGMTTFANRRWQTLSGGERQRVHLARALAQDTPVLLLDEPTNHLDIRHQLETMRLLRDRRVTCLAALHDLNIAALFCDHLLVMDAGRLVAAGPTGEVLTSELVRAVYQVEVEVSVHPRTGRPFVVFTGASSRESDRA